MSYLNLPTVCCYEKQEGCRIKRQIQNTTHAIVVFVAQKEYVRAVMRQWRTLIWAHPLSYV